MNAVILVIDPQQKAVITVLHAGSSRGQRYRRQFYGRYQHHRRRAHWHAWRA
jgi:hypothetical protein